MVFIGRQYYCAIEGKVIEQMSYSAPMKSVESSFRMFRYGVYSTLSSTMFGGML